MDLSKNKLKPPRQLKSERVREKILKATHKLMNRYGYEYLTIRNICEMAGISNGTFYHHFKNKDGLMSYYVAKGYERYKKERSQEGGKLAPHEKLADLLTWFAGYYMEMGLDFVSSYFSPKNKALNVRNFESMDQSHHETVHEMFSLLRQAQETGVIMADIDIKVIYNELNIIFFGNIYDWCLCLGNYDLSEQLNRMLKIHLKHYLS
ncbi:MAG: TetR/AcrR family transcriptional regulator [Desulfatitalea sp.]|nr:TetR/AcrR family transcriptional regulator [Desulfatitalea sp.]